KLLHFRRYRLGELAAMMHHAGFEILKASHLGFFFYPGFWLAKRRNRRLARSSAEIQHAAIDRNMRLLGHSRVLHSLMALERSLGRSLSYPVGIRCILACRKTGHPF
ncbi:MAG TPA: hypothetical protein VMJ30_08065, partial [Gemmatimonadales bacterium]|nr:hypothetical protein [Gemmatimonadales bacterium]